MLCCSVMNESVNESISLWKIEQPVGFSKNQRYGRLNSQWAVPKFKGTPLPKAGSQPFLANNLRIPGIKKNEDLEEKNGLYPEIQTRDPRTCAILILIWGSNWECCGFIRWANIVGACCFRLFPCVWSGEEYPQMEPRDDTISWANIGVGV